MSYQELLSRGLPRAQVQYTKGASIIQDQYQFGSLEGIPAPNLIGFVTRCQADLLFKSPPEGPPDMCLIFWDGETFHWFVDPNIPVDGLLGALEMLKQFVVLARLQPQRRLIH